MGKLSWLATWIKYLHGVLIVLIPVMYVAIILNLQV